MNSILKEAERNLRKAAGLKNKEERPIYKASFSDLIDLVLNDDEVKFLTSDGQVYSQRIIDEKIYLPPNQEDLDYLLPNLENVLNEANTHQHPDISDKTDDVYG